MCVCARARVSVCVCVNARTRAHACMCLCVCFCVRALAYKGEGTFLEVCVLYVCVVWWMVIRKGHFFMGTPGIFISCYLVLLFCYPAQSYQPKYVHILSHCIVRE